MLVTCGHQCYCVTSGSEEGLPLDGASERLVWEKKCLMQRLEFEPNKIATFDSVGKKVGLASNDRRTVDLNLT